MPVRKRPSSRASVIDVVEAAYDLEGDGDDRRWADGVLRAFRPHFDGGMGVFAYLSEPGRPFAPLAAFDVPVGWDQSMAAVLRAPAASVLLTPRRPALTASDGIGRDALAAIPEMQHWRAHGVADGIGVTANDGTGRLLTFVSLAPVFMSLGASATRRLEQVAAHIAAGFRLRRAVRQPPTAVLTPGGKVVHAEGTARETSALQMLRDAARAVDRARGSLRRADQDAAVELWKVLVKGQWSLVDQFDSDGRRHLIVRENEPHVRDPRGLAPREHQVMAYTALGHSLKLIAYEMGLPLSTVANARKRALRKLGLLSRIDVVRWFATVEASESLSRAPDAPAARRGK